MQCQRMLSMRPEPRGDDVAERDEAVEQRPVPGVDRLGVVENLAGHRASLRGLPHVEHYFPGRAPLDRESSARRAGARVDSRRSEEHTSELQSPVHLVCRLLLEKKKQTTAHCT